MTELAVITTNAGRAAILDAELQGLTLRITHCAVGSEGYTPAATATALRTERERVEIASSRVFPADYRLDLSVILDSALEYWVREVGFFSEDGTLVFLWSAPAASMTLGYKSAQVRFLLGVSLTIVDVPVTVVQIVDQGQPLELSLAPIEEDLRGTHDADGRHNYQGTDWREIGWLFGAADFEARAEVLRANGQSGFLVGRTYAEAGTEAFNRPFDGGFAAGPNIHNHINYPRTCGAAESTAIINGYYIRTRHLDYTLDTPAAGAYLATTPAAVPAVPPAVLAAGSVANQIAEMRQWLAAYQNLDHSVRDYRPYFRSTLSVLELWPEILNDARTYTETAFSFRHQEEVQKLSDSYALVHTHDATGYKPRFENSSFPVGISRQVLTTGEPVWVLWRARIICVDLGNYTSFPIHGALTPRDQPMVRWHRSYDPAELLASGFQRYHVNREFNLAHYEGRYVDRTDLLDYMMARLPGLNGPGANITESYVDGSETITTKVFASSPPVTLNAANYTRRYSISTDATGRQNHMRGFNDPTLFMALTTRSQVAPIVNGARTYRCSYAIPLEVVLRTPLESWNPYGLVPVADSVPVNGAGTLGSPYSAIREDSYWYRVPADIYTNPTGDPADTGSNAVYVLDSGSVARLVRGSGIIRHMPETTAGLGPIRVRYPIYPQYHEGGHAQGMIEAVSGDIAEAMMTVGNELMRQRAIDQALEYRIRCLESRAAPYL